MRISIDLDGVVSNFTNDVIQHANKLWPGKLKENFDPPDWDYTGYLSKDDFSDIWVSIKNTNNFWVNALPYIDNLNSLNSFLKATISDIFFVTARAETKGDSVQKQTYDWFIKNGVEIAGQHNLNYSSIVPVKIAGLKKQVMEALGIQISIDDHGPTVEECNKLPNHRAFLLDRSWNQEYNQPRVFSLEEFLRKI